MPLAPLTRPAAALLLGVALPVTAGAQAVAYRCTGAQGRALYQQAPCTEGVRVDLSHLNLLQAYRPPPRPVPPAVEGAEPAAQAVEIGPALRAPPPGRLQRL